MLLRAYSNSDYDFSKEKSFLVKLDNTVQLKKQVHIIQSNSALAYVNDKNQIHLNFNEIKQRSTSYFDFLLASKSLNYHELAHVMYTKHGYTSDSSVREALNILEDQRIETLFSTRYPRAKHYFRYLSVTYLFKNISPELYSIVYGRRLLIHNNELMSIAKNKFVEKHGRFTTERIEKIIDEYLYTSDVKRQRQLAELFADLMSGNLNNPMSNYSTNKKNDRKAVTKDEKDSSEKVKEQIESDENKSNDKETEKLTEELSSNPSEESNESDEKANQIRDGITDEIDETVENDVERQMDIMGKYGFGDKSDGDRNRQDFLPTSKHISQAKQLSVSLNRLKTDLGNMTVYNKKHGKLNLRKAMINEGSNTFTDFKQFIPSRLNKTKMLCSILVDSSGSMTDRHYDLALSSGYTIAKAFENIGSMCKLVEFSCDFKTLKQFEQPVDRVKLGRNYNGGTNILGALKDTTKSVQATSKKYGINNKFVIVITDGAFNNAETTAHYVQEMQKLGIHVYVFKIQTNAYYWGRQYDDYYNKVTVVENFESLNQNMVEIVNYLQKKIIVEVQQNGNRF